jgi:hypothetical protein
MFWTLFGYWLALVAGCTFGILYCGMMALAAERLGDPQSRPPDNDNVVANIIVSRR